MKLKYQDIIDEFKLPISCPENGQEPENIECFRWVFNTIENQQNFLPNFAIDRTRPGGFNYSKANDIGKCRRCGCSYYLSAEKALNSWGNLNPRNQQNLGYTHLCKGVLDKGDGIMTSPDTNGHFGFYEADGAELSQKFTIFQEL